MNKKLLPILSVLFPLFAFAHPVHGEGRGFLEGFAHPVMGLDHLLAMVCAGLLAAALPGKVRWVCLLAFTVGLALGAAAGFLSLFAEPFEPGIILSVTVFGILVALARPNPVWLAPALLGVFALFHGHAHAVEMPEATHAVAFMAGFALSSIALQFSGVLLALVLRELPRAALTMRAAGGLFALSGAWLFFN